MEIRPPQRLWRSPPKFIHETFGMTNPSIFRLLSGGEMSEPEMARHSARKEECYREIARGKIALMEASARCSMR